MNIENIKILDMISVQNLSFRYSKNEKLFNELDLELKPGMIYGLLGKNGAGKTSLLKIIAGMLYPDNGECLLDGVSTTDRLPATFNDMYFIPEEFKLPSITIEAFLKANAPFYSKFNYSLFESCLQEFQLNRSDNLKQLSFGQKKKAILSFGLSTNTKYLILDEPTNGLDIPSKSQFRKMVAAALTDDRSFIISTHQVRDLESLIDPVIVLDNGKIIFHEGFENIGEKLALRVSSKLDLDEVIHYEKSLGGYSMICKNKGYEYTDMNLELLFNAVITQADTICEIFNRTEVTRN